jgi:hypothetical protein
LKLAAQSQAMDNAELREAVRREIRTILLRAADLRPAIVAAYGEGSPEGKQLIEKSVSEVDPAFAASLGHK